MAAAKPVPRQRVSNSQIEYELQLMKLQIKEQVKDAVTAVEAKVEAKSNGLSERIVDLTNSLDGHLFYHSELVEAAKQLADRRFKIYTLLVSILMMSLTAVSIFIGVSN